MDYSSNYLLGSPIETWQGGNAKTVTFIVTEDCNLVCKYCYITGKNKRNKMSFETAKKAVDYILGHPEQFPEKNIIWEFIGGEPTLEIELIDQICDYIKMELYRLNHKWFGNYMFNFSTNGVLYQEPAVQRFIEKNKDTLSIGFSVDGNKIKHDLQRVKPDGSGSYDDVVRNVPLWMNQFPGSATKATFASGDLPYIKDSIISLWNLGIKTVSSNLIFENDWKEGDEEVFESQLRELADYIIENRLWNEYNCTFFTDNVGFPLTDERKKENWCGAGRMLAIDYRGKFFPCVRFVGYSLNHRDEYVIGDIENGLDHSKVRPFLALTLQSQSTEECIECQVADGCAWCQGFNYDEARIDTIYERATYICNMHKARVRANDYYWNRLQQEYNVVRGHYMPRKDQMYFLLANQSTRHCSYEPQSSNNTRMSLEIFREGLEYARQRFLMPVFLLPRGEQLTPEQQAMLKGHSYILISDQSSEDVSSDTIVVYDNTVDTPRPGNNSILLVKRDQLKHLREMVQTIFMKNDRVNLIIEQTSQFSNQDIELYEAQLMGIAYDLVEMEKKAIIKEINVLNDRIYLEEMANCNAGIDSFTLAPDGKFYICPGFYFDPIGVPVGSLQEGISFTYQDHLTRAKSSICSECDAYHCKRCVYQHKKETREYLIPHRNECILSHVERRVSKYYAKKLVEHDLLPQNLQSIDTIFPELIYLDPLEKLLNK